MQAENHISYRDMIQHGISVAAPFKVEASEEEIDHLTDKFYFRAAKRIKEHYKSIYRATDSISGPM